MVHDVEVVRKFYEGGGREEPIPWAVWRAVIWMWLPFISALFLMMISSMAILRKQWIVTLWSLALTTRHLCCDYR